MAAANESQGLKIAVAVFVTLAVIFAVTTYFSYQAYSVSDAKMMKAESDAKKANDAANLALTNYDEMRKSIGTRAEEIDLVKGEIKKEYTAIDEKLKSMIEQVNDAVAKAQASGAQGPELEEAKQSVLKLAADYRGEPNKTYISALSRMTDLLKNLSVLSTRMALNYVDAKRTLESANTVNAGKLNEQVAAVDAKAKDLAAEHDRHESDRGSLIARLDKFQTENASLQAKIANLEAKLRETADEDAKKLSLAQIALRQARDINERKEIILERPDGIVTYVDYTRGELHCNLTRSQGARPQMKFTIFDSKSPGLPTDKPKGTMELIQVTDQYSIGRIVKTFTNIDPIKEGDFVYSPAWSPNEPMRFALIGKIDMNRDGKDDREDLKRMIASAGGLVDYDLPPPDVGKESGKLTGRDAWYVDDTRTPFREVYGKSGVTALEDQEFTKKQSEAIREARAVGVRPMPIERLLPFLGYDFHAGIVGRAEAVDLQSLKRLVAPKQDQNTPKAEAPPTGDAAAPKEEAPKEEPPKEDK